MAEGDPGDRIGGGADHAVGEAGGAVRDERVIQEVERLERDGRPAADIGRRVGIRPVEERQERVLHQALGHQVDAAVIRGIDRLEGVVLGPVPVFNSGKWVPARPGGVEASGDGEHGVADRFGVEPTAGEAPEQAVAGIEGGIAGVGVAGELVGRREHDLPMDCLDRPSSGDEPGREPVEQLRVGRRLAADAEIRGRGDDPAAEMVLPCGIRLTHHPGRERMTGAGQPARQLVCGPLLPDAIDGGASPDKKANRGTPCGTTGPEFSGGSPPASAGAARRSACRRSRRRRAREAGRQGCALQAGLLGLQVSQSSLRCRILGGLQRGG